MDVPNAGQLIISVGRFIDEYNSCNSSLADLMCRSSVKNYVVVLIKL